MSFEKFRPFAAIALIGSIAAATYFVGVSNGEKQRDVFWIAAIAQSKEESDALINEKNNEIASMESHWRSFYEEQVRDARNENLLLQDRIKRAHDSSSQLLATITEITEQLQKREERKPSAVAGKRQANSDPGVLLAIVLRELDGAAGELAQEADDARKRGARCESFYYEITGAKIDY